MKRFYYIVAMVAALLSATSLYAQEEGASRQNQARKAPRATRGERAAQKDAGALPDLTVRAQEMNERLTQQVGNARWMRVIYRQVDLTQEQNAPLYYPVHPMNGQMNLFSVIFRLMSENKIKAYEYLDGYEAFDDDHLINFKELLDRFYILYEEIPGRAGQEPSFVINESDVPSEEVKSYYVKEAWYFDQNNSVFDVKTLALCPILTSTGDMGETTMPMFWLPYENIRPYINTAYVMTSSVNNATTFTIDDYFRRRMFKGDIIKTQNLMNRPLQAYCPTPDSMKREQERIENQLVAFEKALWVQPDTTNVDEAAAKEVKKGKKSKTSVRGGGASAAQEAKQKEPKQKEVKVKAPKPSRTSNSNAVHSVRRRR